VIPWVARMVNGPPEPCGCSRCRGPRLRLAAVRHLPGICLGVALLAAVGTASRTSQPAKLLCHAPSAEVLHDAGGGGGRPEVDWQETDPEKVLVSVPDREKVRALIQLYEKVTRA